MNRFALIYGLFMSFVSLPAVAYIGPGLAGGTIIAVVGIVGSIFLALFGVLYYPIKRAWKKRKADKEIIPEQTEKNNLTEMEDENRKTS